MTTNTEPRTTESCKMKNINRIYNIINRSLFYTDGNLNYDRITEAITLIANEIRRTDYDECDSDYWTIGEFEACPLTELIVGAYWHYVECHSGQDSAEYVALSALGRIFNPGMSCCEQDNEAYLALNSFYASTKSTEPQPVK